MNFRSVNFNLLVLFILITFLSLVGVISITAKEIATYAFFCWGISFFYSSYLKQYQTGIVIGSILFLTGSILFVFSKFEILNFGTVFFPSALLIVGLSLLIANLLTKPSSILVLLSILSLFAGTWLTISRGTATLELYLTAAFDLFKYYWVIAFCVGVIIFLTARSFKKRNSNQI